MERDNLVGSVICGNRLWDVKRSNNSLHIAILFILRRSRLQSTANLMFDISMDKITLVNSLLKCLIYYLTLLGGLYMLPIVIAFDNTPRITLVISPSHYSYVFIFNCTSY